MATRQKPSLGPGIEPMLGRLVRELPVGDYLYEPKWDGFRCLAFRCGDAVDLRSRHRRPLARYFPEVTEAITALPGSELALDGELIAPRDGRLDFAALMQRLHPAASRVERLRSETPAIFVAFDLLAAGDDDLCALPFEERRRRLEAIVGEREAGTIRLTPITADPSVAREWLRHYCGGGIDGVIAKPREMPYLPGARRMLKVKHERTADCVVAGMRPVLGEPLAASLLLGLYAEDGSLQHIGVASSFRRPHRAE